MPMPRPQRGEVKGDFIQRCMTDDVMRADFPDNDQRRAVCETQWSEAMTDNRERRSFPADIEVRGGGDAEPTKLVGHAAVFEQLSGDLGGFREKIAAGAFRDTIANEDVRALFNHNPDFVLGRQGAGTLTLEEDDRGLRFEIDPPNTTFARDLIESVGRGDIRENSFGFITQRDSVSHQNATPVRTLEQVRLLDVSPVTYPAYPQTDVALRSIAAHQGNAAAETRGAALSAHLGLLIAERVQVNDSRQADVISQIAEQAGRTEDAVRAVLRAETRCPPPDFLDAFATVLREDARRLRLTAERDGCRIDSGERDGPPAHVVNKRRHLDLLAKE